MPVVIPRLIVEVFQHTNFRGRMGYVLEPVPHTGHIGFQDNISSLRVYKGPNFSGSPNYKVILHQHVNYKGKKLALGITCTETKIEHSIGEFVDGKTTKYCVNGNRFTSRNTHELLRVSPTDNTSH